MSNLFEEVLEDAGKVQDKLLGPSYPYYLISGLFRNLTQKRSHDAYFVPFNHYPAKVYKYFGFSVRIPR